MQTQLDELLTMHNRRYIGITGKTVVTVEYHLFIEAATIICAVKTATDFVGLGNAIFSGGEVQDTEGKFFALSAALEAVARADEPEDTETAYAYNILNNKKEKH